MASTGGSDAIFLLKTVKVTNLSPNTAEHDIRDFFSFCGDIERIDLQSIGNEVKVCYVTFRNAHAVDTAVLLSGATIVDQIVTIVKAEDYLYDSSTQQSAAAGVEPSPVLNAVFRVQDVMTSMLAKGYVLGRDALEKAKAFDENHKLSANATAAVSSLDSKFGVSDTISSSTAAVSQHMKAIDEKFQVSEKTRMVFSVAEEKVGTAAATLLNNKYIFTGASWAAGAFSKVTKAAEEATSKAFGSNLGAK